jgi:hypothetical protein
VKRSCKCGNTHDRYVACPIAIQHHNRSNQSYSAEYKRNERILRQRFRIGDVCIICNTPITSIDQLSIEHVIARRNNGSDHISNLGYAHRRCNYSWNKRLISVNSLALRLALHRLMRIVKFTWTVRPYQKRLGQFA